jgi:hypothetical protein
MGSGGTIRVEGQPFDVVWVERNSFPMPGSCRCPITYCFDAAVIPLDEDGQGQHSNMADDLTYYGYSNYTGCSSTVYLPCNGVVTMYCDPPVGAVTFGTITIQGAQSCRLLNESTRTVSPDYPIPPEPKPKVCNDGTLTVVVEGTTVSTFVQDRSTANSVALALSSAINTNATLNQKYFSVVSANQITLKGRAQSSDPAKLDVPWSSTCTYDNYYFSDCAFKAILAPVSTTGSSPPLE